MTHFRSYSLLAAGILSFLVLVLGPVWITPWLLMGWGSVFVAVS